MLVERPLLAILLEHTTARVVGRHRTRFLHAMTTADINKMAPGTAGFALMATSTGRHVGQMRLEVEAEAVTLSARKASLDTILEALKKHRVADDVRWSPEETPSSATLAVYGPRAGELIAKALGEAARPAPGTFVDATFEGVPLRIVAIPAGESELGREAMHLRTRADVVPHLRVRLLSAGAEPLDERAWERLRIEAGWPLDGVDVSGDDVALASERLGGTVSWNKGCFLGQEVYVMARDRGELPKRLRGVLLAGTGGGAPTPRAELTDETGKVAGVLGSFAPTTSGYLALAMLKRKQSEPGTVVRLPDGREGRVVALPQA